MDGVGLVVHLHGCGAVGAVFLVARTGKVNDVYKYELLKYEE